MSKKTKEGADMFRGLMQETPLLISSLLDYAARYHGDTEIVSRLPSGAIHRYGYRALRARSLTLAAALTRRGVRPGDRIATLAWNTYRHMELYYGVSGMGAVLHTVNPRLFVDQLDYIFNHAEDRLLFFDLTFVKLIKELRPRLRSVETFIGLGSPEEVAAARAELPDLIGYEELLTEAADAAYEFPALDEHTASSLCYTSGTTGNPKGVLYSHRSTVLHSFAVCSADGLALSSRDSVLVIVPMFHANAWGVPYAAAMCGAKVVLPGPLLDGDSVCQLLTGEGCNLSMGVPTVWLNFLAYLDQHPERRPTALKRILVGGSAASASLIERLEKGLHLEVHHLWGMTETSPLGTSSSPPQKLLQLEPEARRALKLKQGRALYGVELKIVGDDGEELPRDGQAFGMVKVRGPWVVRRYFKDEGGDIVDDKGFFATGDVATLDGDGYMQITDRAKDVIKSGGEWISSIELENAAMAHPAVQQAAVIGVAHAVWQERPLLLIVLKPGVETRPSLEALRQLIGQKVARWWLPDAVEFVSELPHTATGKVSKLTLRKRFADYKLPENSTDAAARDRG
jgi:acyl-CoA synthetase (AMP-forming)/AMP-acid ligase II